MISSNHPLAGATPPRETSVSEPTRSVLLVDDESTLRSALRRYFVRRGWRVVEAEDGECARAMLLDGETLGGGFDVVVTDMRMPRLNGMELHALISDASASLGRRFLFSSGDTGDEEALAFLARTGCPAISKPFELRELLAMVEQVAADHHETN